MTQRVHVGLAGAPHDVLVGPGLLDDVAAHLPTPPGARTVALVTNPTVAGLYAERVEAGLADRGLQVVRLEVADSERAKSPVVLGRLWDELAVAGLQRGDLVVTLGGGVVSDLGGLLAATWHRGVAVVHLPTTLLGQVDAAVGGKTGINLDAGKNLVGAFHQPLGVLCDTATLATLPVRELRSGLGEVAKYGFIADPVVLDLLERDPAAAVDGDSDLLTEVVLRGVRVKARVVAADERESGERALLNYGHTVGHAIEALGGYDRWRHGEAVALGMVAAARLAERLGVTEAGLTDRTVGVLAPLGLPVGGVDLDPDRVWELLRRDKKTAGDVRFVLCERPGTARLVAVADRTAVDEVVISLRD